MAALRGQVPTQQALIREQASLLARQQEAIADLSARLEAVSKRVGQLEGPKEKTMKRVASFRILH